MTPGLIRERRSHLQPADYDIAQLKDAVAAHVTDMLTRLKEHNIEPEWVQIGNETRTVCCIRLDIDNGSNFADLINSGYSAVKELFPECLVLVHLDSGQRADLYTRMFNYLKSHNAKYDVIGMSLYPEPENWESVLSDCIANIESVIQTYNKPVMICEVGMSYDQDEACKDLLGG